jgi:hypothetical protein
LWERPSRLLRVGPPARAPYEEQMKHEAVRLGGGIPMDDYWVCKPSQEEPVGSVVLSGPAIRASRDKESGMLLINGDGFFSTAARQERH